MKLTPKLKKIILRRLTYYVENNRQLDCSLWQSLADDITIDYYNITSLKVKEIFYKEILPSLDHFNYGLTNETTIKRIRSLSTLSIPDPEHSVKSSPGKTKTSPLKSTRYSPIARTPSRLSADSLRLHDQDCKLNPRTSNVNIVLGSPRTPNVNEEFSSSRASSVNSAAIIPRILIVNSTLTSFRTSNVNEQSSSPKIANVNIASTSPRTPSVNKQPSSPRTLNINEQPPSVTSFKNESSLSINDVQPNAIDILCITSSDDEDDPMQAQPELSFLLPDSDYEEMMEEEKCVLKVCEKQDEKDSQKDDFIGEIAEGDFASPLRYTSTQVWLEEDPREAEKSIFDSPAKNPLETPKKTTKTCEVKDADSDLTDDLVDDLNIEDVSSELDSDDSLYQEFKKNKASPVKHSVISFDEAMRKIDPNWKS